MMLFLALCLRGRGLSQICSKPQGYLIIIIVLFERLAFWDGTFSNINLITIEMLAFIIILIAKFKQMPNESLPQKLRRSASIKPSDLYRSFMEYAETVRDELTVYLYMEENGIVSNLGEYWLRRLQVLYRMAMYKQLSKEIAKLTQEHLLEGPYHRKLASFQQSVHREMSIAIYGQYRGKRTVEDFDQRPSPSQVHKKVRKIGSQEIFVDPECRENYSFQDYCEYLQNHMKKYCEGQRNYYQTQQSKKQLSFIGQEENQLLKKSSELITQNRFSQKQDPEGQWTYKTPRNSIMKEHEENSNRVSHNRRSIKQYRSARRKDSSRDSVEILRQFRKSLSKSKQKMKSPRFNDQQQQSQRTRMEVARFEPIKKEQNSSFSFSKRQLDKEVVRISSEEDLNNQGFICYSFSKDSNKCHSQQINKEDFQLDLLLKLCQKETFERPIETRTLSSELDSNQENFEFATSDSREDHPFPQGRKPFEVLYTREDEFSLEDLILQDDLEDKNPEQQRDDEDEQSTTNLCVKKYQVYHSQKQGRLSNISEEGNSLFLSEGKGRGSH